MLTESQSRIIRLNVGKKQILNESFLSTFAGLTKMLLSYIMGDTAIPVKVKENQRSGTDPQVKISGTPAQVDAFTSALRGEKDYMITYMEHGVSDEKTLNSRHKLNRAVEAFEVETGLRWPFKN